MDKLSESYERHVAYHYGIERTALPGIELDELSARVHKLSKHAQPLMNRRYTHPAARYSTGKRREYVSEEARRLAEDLDLIVEVGTASELNIGELRKLLKTGYRLIRAKKKQSINSGDGAG